MLFGMAAATSALDLIKTLTQAGASPKPAGGAKFSAISDSSTTATASGSSGPTSLISPDTMTALLAAQGQSDTSTPVASRSDALKDLFSKIDGDGDGKVTKSEFENALGAGGTNTANADSVFGKLNSDDDGSISLGELGAALKPKHHGHGPKQGGAPGAASRANSATQSYTALEQMFQRQSQILTTPTTSPSVSVSV